MTPAPRKGPLGSHFFDRNSGLNCLLDEIVPPAHEWSAAPRTLSVALTTACDSDCPHCYADKAAASLSRERVIEWAVELDQNGGHSIGFGGGEPTLYPDFPDLCRSVATATNLAVTVTTNGHNITPELATRLTGAIHFVRISLGGLHGVYERTHLRSFSRLLESIACIQQVVPCGFNFLVTQDSVGQLDEAAAFAARVGIREFLLLPVLSRSGALLLSSESQKRLSAWVEMNHSRHPFSIAMSVCATEFITSPRLPVDDPRGVSYDCCDGQRHWRDTTNASECSYGASQTRFPSMRNCTIAARGRMCF